MWPFSSIREMRLGQKCLEEILNEANKCDIKLIKKFVSDDKKLLLQNTVIMTLAQIKKEKKPYTIDFFVEKKNAPRKWSYEFNCWLYGHRRFDRWEYDETVGSSVPEGFIKQPIGTVINPEYNDKYFYILRLMKEEIEFEIYKQNRERELKYRREQLEDYVQRLSEWESKSSEYWEKNTPEYCIRCDGKKIINGPDDSDTQLPHYYLSCDLCVGEGRIDAKTFRKHSKPTGPYAYNNNYSAQAFTLMEKQKKIMEEVNKRLKESGIPIPNTEDYLVFVKFGE